MWARATRARSAQTIKPSRINPSSNVSYTRRMASQDSKVAGYLTTSRSTKSANLPFDAPKLWSGARPKNEKKPGETRVFYDVDGQGAVGVVASTGKVAEKKSATEGEKREAVRVAVAEGIKKLRDAGATEVAVDVEGANAQSAGESKVAAFGLELTLPVAEGAALALFNFTLKTNKKKNEQGQVEPEKDKVKFHPLGIKEDDPEWQTGVTVAYAQNLAREVRWAGPRTGLNIY